MLTTRLASLTTVVVAALALVHCLPGAATVRAQQAGTQSAQSPPAAAKGLPHKGPLPPNVIDMRDMILSAVHSGRIEDLQTAIDQNELPPECGAPKGTAMIDYLRTTSADGAGREILAILDNLLQSDPASLPIGRDPENNSVFIWPAISEADLGSLTPAQEVSLYRLMPVAEAKAMIAAKKWTWWRLAIGADGTWLTFLKAG